VALALSTDNGRRYTTVWTAPVGRAETTVDLGETVLRRYNYLVKIEIGSTTPGGAGIDALAIESDFQHAPRTLPWLGGGSNTITVAADAELGPALTTRTVACRITPDATFTKNETTTSMGVTFDNLDVRDSACWWKQGVGTMTVPVAVPGDLVALRLSAQVRARGPKDRVAILASTDGGGTWRDLDAIHGPTPGATRSFRFAGWPAGTRDLLVRFALSGTNTIGVMSFRVDADYRDPLAEQTPRPFRVIHRWKEAGQPREHIEPIKALPATYTIEAGAEPEMVSVTAEMPGAG
jgi:hypothetical protein